LLQKYGAPVAGLFPIEATTWVGAGGARCGFVPIPADGTAVAAAVAIV